jgi:hypothetical protein
MNPEPDDNQEPEPIQYPALMKLKKRELANHLSKLLDKGEPRIVINEMRDTILRQKEQLRRHRIHETQQNILWGDVLKPLQAERRNVRASLKYKADDDTDARVQAFEAYAVVLAELHNRITSIKNSGDFTPSTYAAEKNLPNRGLHWSDFIPARIKLRITDLFDAVPHTAKARRKIPFERVVTADIHDKRKRRLVNRTTKELLHANQDHTLCPTQDTQARVDKLKTALAAIEKLDPNEPVPTTWHGLY